MKDIDIHWYKSIDSTNSEAVRCLDKCENTTVWFAEYQTNGRGQRNNVWSSRSGQNLTFTILFKPDNILASSQFVVSQLVSLGVVKYLAGHGIPARIKWPNDIYVKDNKICGILIENRISNDKLSASIVGVGLNLNQKAFSEDIPNPTSVIIEKERHLQKSLPALSLESELEGVLADIMSYYWIYSIKGAEHIVNEYADLLYRRLQYYRYLDLITDTIFTGRIAGVNNKNARLIIEDEGGTFKEFAFQEIKYII